ncbi:XAC2610-related protein [Carboxylicivirga sp. RSCT41]|uniref:XAC2610-related protein n=1 Tax=Carboxylicivirga agarovorans TaxID=3417570 RepID=UPI003D32798C
MKKNITIILIGLLLFQCKNKTKSEQTDIEPAFSIEVSDTIVSFEQETEEFSILEIITDSLRIAENGNYKISLKQIQATDGVFAEFDFFERNNSNWKHIQNFRMEKDAITDLSPEFLDYNNDGFNDLTFRNGVAARGSNELRSLFIFDKEKKELVYIKNSDSYPNIRYNAELNCIDAWLIYGGSTTLFLKIESDTLREFAGVSLFDTREVFIIDKSGKREILSQELIKDSVVYRRYSNYSPLKENKEFQ